MTAKVMLGLMVAASVLAVITAARRTPAAERPIVTAPVKERPWLSKAAATQIVGDGGMLGPLFDEMELGAAAPSIEERERIEDFARAHGVEIDLEIIDANLASVRFAVTYGGCCGYEGADLLALRLQRPSTGHCCVCGPETWINDWAIAHDGMHMRASVRVNRVEVRWERALTVRGLLERASDLIGQDPETVRAAAGERWRDSGTHVVLALPTSASNDSPIVLRDPEDGGVRLGVEHGRIAEVRIRLSTIDDSYRDNPAVKTLSSLWGRPITRIGRRTWRTAHRTVTEVEDAWPPQLAIRAR